MVSRKTVAKLMRSAGLAGIPRRQTRKNPKVVVTGRETQGDLFDRRVATGLGTTDASSMVDLLATPPG